MNKIIDQNLNDVVGGTDNDKGSINVSYVDNTLTVKVESPLNRVHLTINNHSKFASLVSDLVAVFNNVERVSGYPYKIKVVYSDSTYNNITFINPTDPFEKTF